MGRAQFPGKEISTVSISVTYTDGETSVVQLMTNGQAAGMCGLGRAGLGWAEVGLSKLVRLTKAS
jgi:hypothetical protein